MGLYTGISALTLAEVVPFIADMIATILAIVRARKKKIDPESQPSDDDNASSGSPSKRYEQTMNEVELLGSRQVSKMTESSDLVKDIETSFNAEGLTPCDS